VWPLVFPPCADLNVLMLVHAIAGDEARRRQFGERLIDLHVLIWKYGRLNFHWSVLQSSLTISNRPQSRKQQAHDRREFSERLVGEKSRSDVASTSHVRSLPYASDWYTSL
jgi:hypothetical protein